MADEERDWIKEARAAVEECGLDSDKHFDVVKVVSYWMQKVKVRELRLDDMEQTLRSEQKTVEYRDKQIAALEADVAHWTDVAAQNQRNTDYYRGLLQECGGIIGTLAYTADDGTVMDDVLCAKIPELFRMVCNLPGQMKGLEPE